MAWTTPKTDFANGDVLTATQMNAVGADLQYLYDVDPNAVITTKGDLIAGNSSGDAARVAVGTNGQLLTADSSAANGVTWTTLTAGSMTQLSSTSMSGNSFTFSSISGSYKNLVVILRGFNTTSTGTSPYLWHTINGGVANASFANGNNTTTTGNYTDATRARMTIGQTFNSAGQAASCMITIPDYVNTTGRKISTWNGAFYDLSASRFNAFSGSAGFETTSAVTSITISLSGTETFNAGTAILYGVN